MLRIVELFLHEFLGCADRHRDDLLAKFEPGLGDIASEISFALLENGTCLLASLLLHADPGPWLVSGLFLQGIARSSMMTVAILLLMEAPGVPKARLGLAAGLFFTAAEIGGVLGPLTIGVLSDLTNGFSVPLTVLSGVCLVLLVLIGVLARSRKAPNR